MATLSYNPGSHTVNISERWINIYITVSGAQGGNGGADSSQAGGTRGPGRKGTFRLNNEGFARTLSLYIGSQGGNGWGCVANSGNGSGGSSPVAPGGGGGRTGPQGCSGGGAGGGGATGVYDSFANTYIILAGGGGGGGGGSWPDSWLRGGNGGSAGGWSGSVSGISGGGTGRSQGFDGGGGGGGGGGASGGGGGREGADDRAGRYPSTGGGGGGSFYRTSYVTYSSGNGGHYGNGYVSIQYDLANPTVTSLTTSDSDVIRGQSVTVSWTTQYTQFISRLELSGGGIAAIDVTGQSSITLQPQQTEDWRLTAFYAGGSHARQTTQVVYIPPVVTMTSNPNPIPLGASSRLEWQVTGDASTMIISPSIGSTNLSSFANVSPTVTTTYTATASGAGGVDTEEITLVVWQPPSVTLTGPTVVNYGSSGINVVHSQVNATSVYELEVIATDLDGATTTETFDLGPAQSGSDTYFYAPTWTNRGPSSFNFNLRAVGDGNLNDTESILIPVYIDQMPDAIDVPSSEVLKDEEPVITPESEVSLTLLVDDIDIPVEIKSDYPIKVEIDSDGVYRDITQI